MKNVMFLLGQFLCPHPKHKLAPVRNIHGDEINAAGGNRSEWVCLHCRKAVLKKELINREDY